MSVTRLSGKAVVASWKLAIGGGIESIIALHKELLRKFPECTTLHFDVEQPCYIRVLVRAEQDADALAAEIASVIHCHKPHEASRVDTRVVPVGWQDAAATVTQWLLDNPFADSPEANRDGPGAAAYFDRCHRETGTEPELPTAEALKGEALTLEANRYWTAAKALWQLLDDIDTVDDAARDDDASYRATARTIAKRRSECARSPDGQTLLWSWQSPLPPELLDVAAQQLHAVMHGPAPQFLERAAAKLQQGDRLPPEFYDITSSALQGDAPQKLRDAVKLLEEWLAKPITERISPEVVTRSQLAEFIGVSPERVTVEDGKFIVTLTEKRPPVTFEPYHGALDENTTEEESVRWCPGEPEARQPIDSVGALMPEGHAGFAPSEKPDA